MLLSDFDFELPEELIAIRPASPRSSARLLMARGDKIDDRLVSVAIDKIVVVPIRLAYLFWPRSVSYTHLRAHET